MVDPDWRLEGQERQLQGVRLVWRRYRAPSLEWDHDHCQFCWATFMDRDLPNVLREGYATEDNPVRARPEGLLLEGGNVRKPDDRRWICRTCFEDFHDRFGWTVADVNPGDASSRP